MPANAIAASLSDIPTLVQLMQEFYAESNYPLDRQWAANSFSTLLNQRSLGSAWLGCCGEEAAGYAVLTVRFSMEYGGLDAFIDDLFVRPAYRRQGIGTAMLEALFNECRDRGVLAVHVEVGEDNDAAKAVYSKFGMGLRSDRRQLLTVRISP